MIFLYAIFVHPETFQAVSSQEELMQKTVELTDGVLKYATQISALAALCTIPILAWMFRKDRKLEKESGVTPQKKAAFGKYILIVGISIPVALGVNNLLLLSNLSEVSEGYKQASEMLYTPPLPGPRSYVLALLFRSWKSWFREDRSSASLREDYADGWRGSDLAVFCAVFRIVSWKSACRLFMEQYAGLLLAYVYEKFGSLKAPVLYAYDHEYISLCSD